MKDEPFVDQAELQYVRKAGELDTTTPIEAICLSYSVMKITTKISFCGLIVKSRHAITGDHS